MNFYLNSSIWSLEFGCEDFRISFVRIPVSAYGIYWANLNISTVFILFSKIKLENCIFACVFGFYEYYLALFEVYREAIDV